VTRQNWGDFLSAIYNGTDVRTRKRRRQLKTVGMGYII
jgi:hypothetical protein